MIVQADARALPIADGSVQCVVTSPPYWGLRDYGIAGQIGLDATPDAYVSQLVAVFREVWRVLKDDGTVWLNLGDSYCTTPRGNRPGDYSTSSLTNPWRQDAIERGRVPDAESKQATNLGSNFAGPNRRHHFDGLKHKDLVGIPWRVAFALQADGWYLRSDIIWSKPNPMPESVTDRPTKAHEYLFLLTKSERYYYDAETIKEAATDTGRINGREGRDEAPEARPPNSSARTLARLDYSALGRNRRSVWHIPTQPYSGAHFATFPEKLVEPCILAGSRPGDVVCDPFCGSGTVGVVALCQQRRFIGCDLNPAYLYLAQERIYRRAPLFVGASA